MPAYFFDLETFNNTVSLKTAGVYRYAETAQILLLACAIDDEPVRVLDLTVPRERELAVVWLTDCANGSGPIITHGSFDRTVVKYALGIEMPLRRMWDTMAQALSHSLPGSLDQLCILFGLSEEVRKQSDRGKKLIGVFCGKVGKPRTTKEEKLAEWREFKEYACYDVRAMRALYKSLPRWNYPKHTGEKALYELDGLMNDRGFRIDADLARGAMDAVKNVQTELSNEMQEKTDGEITTALQRDALLHRLRTHFGVDMPDLRAATVESYLSNEDLPQGVRELLEIRASASTTSTAKYSALLNAASSDGRLRGTLQFCGASRTGRWSGRKFQPQNLPSLGLPPQKEIDKAVEAFRIGAGDVLLDDVMGLASGAIRGCVIPSEGNKLVVADLSNIEGRVAAWIAGEHPKTSAFRDFDEGKGPDLYIKTFSRTFGVPEDKVTSFQRQIGKVMELGLGYQGGVGAFCTFADAYRINLDTMSEAVRPSIPAHLWRQAEDSYEWAKKQRREYGLAKETYAACDSLKRLWRAAHPNISTTWDALENAFRSAATSKGTYRVGEHLSLKSEGPWVRLILPSGRSLCYPSPRTGEKLSYKGVMQPSKKWGEVDTYGGKLFENVCQAVARDIMAEAMLALKQQGFELLLTVHDEIIAEVSAARINADVDMVGILSTPPVWALDLPLAAKGQELTRYRKL